MTSRLGFSLTIPISRGEASRPLPTRAWLEMGAVAEDIGLTIHPHPTLSETVFFAAEIAEGSITDLYMPKR